MNNGDMAAFCDYDGRGLTKREWMAATILAGLCSCSLSGVNSDHEAMEAAVGLADMLLEKLAEGGGNK